MPALLRVLCLSLFPLVSIASPFNSEPAEVDREQQLERAKDAKNAVFTALDSDGNDQLTREEASLELSLSRDFEDFDHNGDGVVDRQEYLRERHAAESNIEEVQ